MLVYSPALPIPTRCWDSPDVCLDMVANWQGLRKLTDTIGVHKKKKQKTIDFQYMVPGTALGQMNRNPVFVGKGSNRDLISWIRVENSGHHVGSFRMRP